MVFSHDNKFILVDGNSLVYRAFFALPPMQSGSGEHTNAVYGFTAMLFKILEEEKPGYVVVAFDPPEPSFRLQIYADYKGHREKTPGELKEQMGRVKEILEALGIPWVEVHGYEADDVIGTLAERAAQATEKALETIIVTGDADLLQLVGERITVFLTRRGITRMDRFDRPSFLAHFGFEPARLVDYKALTGDPSDNIPGVPGVGRKTATKLLQEHGSVAGIMSALPGLGGKVAANLQQYRDRLHTGQKLVALCRKVPLELPWENCRLGGPEGDRLLRLFEELEFRNLAARARQLFPALEQKETVPAKAVSEQPCGEPLTAPAELRAYLSRPGPGPALGILLEYPPALRRPWEHRPGAAALVRGDEPGCFLEPAFLAGSGPAIWGEVRRAIDRGLVVLTHESKNLDHLCYGLGQEPPPITFDTALAAYLAEPTRSSYSLEKLCHFYLGLPREIRERGGGRSKPEPAERGARLAAQAGHLPALEKKLRAVLEERRLVDLYHRLELPLAALLARMERYGMVVDRALLLAFRDEIQEQIEALETEIYRQAGEIFNLNSPRQLQQILFEKLKLPGVRKIKTGQSTDARVLEELAPQHAIVAGIVQYRRLMKLEGTYLSGLMAEIDPRDSRIYTTFNQTATATGRLSSSEPNLQNIPVRQEEGRRIRRAFIPSGAGRFFLSADYSQIELRIMAHLSGDPILAEAFRLEEDIHRRTAAEVFGTRPEEVTPLQRDRAKAVNFGIIYGISDYGLARQLGVSRLEARQYIDHYFKRYRGVERYTRAVVEEARKQGYVTTLLQRRRYLPGLHAANYGRRSLAERVARNTPIQGSAADVIKLAMLRVERLLAEGGFEARMLLQVHDELLFEIDEKELYFLAPLIRREMEQALELSVPLRVDLKWGRNWAELEAFQARQY